jgi:hypothetical protein
VSATRAAQRLADLSEPRDAASLSAVHARDLAIGPLAEDAVDLPQFLGGSDREWFSATVISDAKIKAFSVVHESKATNRCDEAASPHLVVCEARIQLRKEVVAG